MTDNNVFLKARSLPKALALISLGLAGCATPEPPGDTLADLDRPVAEARSEATSQPGDQGSAKQAYYRYIRSAPEEDRGRTQALTRLADLELAESHRLTEQDDYQDDERYRQTLERTIELLNTALAAHPDARDNDQKLYQLAKSYDQLGRIDETQDALERLAREHPQSRFYPEAQFRLAERAFSSGDYMAAEVAYTAALTASRDTNFHERALFKRGWARYRQSLFHEALEDFVAIIHAQDFVYREDVAERDQSIYSEYYRSLGLAMIQSPEPERLAPLLRQQGMDDLLPAYRASSELLANQGRTSDAVAQWQLYLNAEPDPWPALLAESEIVSLWRQNRFHQRALDSTEALYRRYRDSLSQLDSSQHPKEPGAREAIREHWQTAARHYHAAFQEDDAQADFARAQTWYQRYLEHFDGYALQDGVALAYGDLLAETDDTEAAFRQYQRAAFDGQLILNPEAAYAAIALLNELTEQAPERWLARYLQYTTAFADLYPSDPRTTQMTLSAARLAYNQGQYQSTADLLAAGLPQADSTGRSEAQQLLLQSHLELGDYPQAEQVAVRLLAQTDLPEQERQRGRELRALSVYRQAEAAEQDEDWEQAIHHYQRIHELEPDTENAPGGLYNALSLAAEQEQWPRAIALMERFQQQYPEHQYRPDVERQITRAYMATGQTDQAARQYELLADSEQDSGAQQAALWKAAELYEEQEDTERAINAYRRYAHSYPDPYPQNIEAMNKLIGLYQSTGETDNQRFWQRRILQTDRNRSDDDKTERTALLAANAALDLGKAHLERFESTPLSLPLDQSLARKTEHMQNAIRQFATAASYGFAEIGSEARHRIGAIYETLASDLLDSDRPPELSSDELVQYDILLEDRAFPFEDRAIEFYERNLVRAQEEGFTDWMAQSRVRLETLFPVRYARKPKAGLYVSEADRIDSARRQSE